VIDDGDLFLVVGHLLMVVFVFELWEGRVGVGWHVQKDWYAILIKHFI
jgi:hypothetical protein